MSSEKGYFDKVTRPHSDSKCESRLHFETRQSLGLCSKESTDTDTFGVAKINYKSDSKYFI